MTEKINMKGKANIEGKMDRLGLRASNNETLNRTFEAMARIGFAARGIIYFVIGLLAVLLTFGYGGKTTDQQGAISMIGTLPSGRIFLWLILLGLVCYSLWGFIQTIFNPFHQGNDAKGYAIRIGNLVSAVAYALLVLPTLAIISGGAQPAQNGVQQIQIQQYAAKILGIPFGQSLVGMVGIIVIIVGIMQLFKGFTSGFEQQMNFTKLNRASLRRIRFFGRFGTIARGSVLALIGLFIVMAAYTANSQQVKGLDSTLTSLQYQPQGRWLMGVIALGLISLGLYSVCLSLFFRLRIASNEDEFT